MTEANIQPQLPEIETAIRLRILERVKDINAKLLVRLSTAADDLEEGRHRAALGALDGIEKHIHTMRTLLQLLF